MKHIFIYVTNPSKEVAKKIAKHLIRKELVACANIFQASSLYMWKGKLVYETEHNMILKTTANKFESVKKEIEKIHPYAVPCIAKVPVEFNKKYAKWLEGCVTLK